MGVVMLDVFGNPIADRNSEIRIDGSSPHLVLSTTDEAGFVSYTHEAAGLDSGPQALTVRFSYPPSTSPGLWLEVFDDSSLSREGTGQPQGSFQIDNRVHTQGSGDIDYNNLDPAGLSNLYSLRLTGWVIPLHSETYTFYITGDDGIRAWVDGAQIIPPSAWVDQNSTEYSGNISLTAGVPASVWIEHYENTGIQDLKFEWESASQAREVVPEARMRHPNIGDGESFTYVVDIY